MTAPLYLRVLGDGWSELAGPLRRMHGACGILRARGRLRVEHGHHVLTRLTARLLRLPVASTATDTRLVVTPEGDGEHWLRTFDGRRMVTRQHRSNPSEIVERFGVLEFRFHMDVSPSGGLVYVQRAAVVVLGPVRVPLPPCLAPRVTAREEPDGPCRVTVVVSVTLPGVGTLITYDGFMAIEEASA